MFARQVFVNKSYTEFDTNQTNLSDADIGTPTDRQTHGRKDEWGLRTASFFFKLTTRLLAHAA
jgi:hypothetical protein